MGCGYKGDLYLPEPKKAETVVPLSSTANTETPKTDTPKVQRITPE
jgi:predicted small lipoprotein YifL